MRMIICVDRLHYKNHLKTDTYCQRYSNPAHYEADEELGLPAIIDKENSEAAEQTFSWLGKFGNIVRTMGQARAYFLLIRMCDRHNRRNIADRIIKLNDVDLAELCAAYGLARREGEPSDALKHRAMKLLTEASRPYDLAKLDEHKAAVQRAGATGEGI